MPDQNKIQELLDAVEEDYPREDYPEVGDALDALDEVLSMEATAEDEMPEEDEEEEFEPEEDEDAEMDEEFPMPTRKKKPMEEDEDEEEEFPFPPE